MKNDYITRNDIKLLVGVVSIIVVGAFAWSDLKHVANTAAEESKIANEKADIMALDIREIKTIMKQRGLTTYAPYIQVTAPTPAAQSAKPETTVNNYVLPTPEPTPLPEATPTPTPALCVVGVCL